ncbi:MAG: hypothetical protein JW839_19490 [Candidatus Lokiarchaeota archaeon]|nr:hypothetical protein [Candidatus Lokiarchaeota archaeon]
MAQISGIALCSCGIAALAWHKKHRVDVMELKGSSKGKPPWYAELS